MASKILFDTRLNAVPTTDTVNEAGGKAYKFPPKHALAQYAATGCLSDTYYADAESQLAQIMHLALLVPEDFLARVAVYSREERHMKDMPALLTALLHKSHYFEPVFERIINDGKMLRNFVQIIRSGAIGRKSFGSKLKKAIRKWLAKRTPKQIFKQSSGSEPSFGDIIKMIHPKPQGAMDRSLFAYLIGKKLDAEAKEALPQIVKDYEQFKAGELMLPDLPFQFLYSQVKTQLQWKALALQTSWHGARMNLNLFARHGLMDDPEVVAYLAEFLSEPGIISTSKVFPYQILMTLKAIPGVPDKIRKALEDALELATQNVPTLPGQVVVCPDVSGSMSSSITGNRPGARSAVRCVDVAALIACSILRKNPDACVLPFQNQTIEFQPNPRDTVATNAKMLAERCGGGTRCSAPLGSLILAANTGRPLPDVIIYISDNQSWADFRRDDHTQAAVLWREILRRKPSAKLVLIDLQPYTSTQLPDSPNTLNIGGFSDEVFEIVKQWLDGSDPAHWVSVIERIEI